MATFRKLSEGLIEMTHEQQYTFYRTHPKYESPVSLIPIEITKHNGQHSTEALITQPSDLPAAQPPVTPTQSASDEQTAAVVEDTTVVTAGKSVTPSEATTQVDAPPHRCPQQIII